MIYSQTNQGRRAHTTDFIVKGRDFFSAHLDTGGVRIGMVGGVCFDIPKGHAYYERCVECSCEVEIESHFDACMEAS